jgi:hypothetical protein
MKLPPLLKPGWTKRRAGGREGQAPDPIPEPSKNVIPDSIGHPGLLAARQCGTKNVGSITASTPIEGGCDDPPYDKLVSLRLAATEAET